MGFRSQRPFSLLALGLSLSACADVVELPEQQPNDEADVGVRPTFGLGSKPRLCSIDPAEGGSWQSAEGPREALSHRLAATPGALFVASPFALRRSTDAGQSFQVIEAPTASRFPGPMAGIDGTLFIGTDDGALRSEDGGETWLPASAGLDGGISTFHRGKSALLARSNAGSLMRWSAVDSAWEPVESGSSYAPGVAASDGKTVLVDTGAGVLRSTDLAAWSLVDGLEAWGYEDLLIADELGLAITATGEIRRSANAGVSWLPVQQSTAEVGVAARVAQHGNAVFALTDKGVVRSADGGASWGIALAMPPAIGVTEIAEANGILAVDVGEISVTSDGGATWSSAATFADSTPVAFARVGSWLFTSTDAAGVFASSPSEPFQATDASGYFLRDSEEGDNASYLLFSQRPAMTAGYGTSWVTRTADGGDSFEPVPLPSTDDVPGRAFETMAVDGDVILVGGIDAMSASSEGPGVWASLDGGASWSRASEGLPTIDGSAGLYPAVLSLTKRGDAVLALIDNEGVFETRDQGASWQRVGELDVGFFQYDIDQLLVAGDALYLWSSGDSSILRSTGGSWEFVEWDEETTGDIVALSAVGSTLIAARQTSPGSPGSGVYLSNDGGTSWQSSGLDGRVRALFVDGETLWAGVEGQGTFSVDVGACR